MTGNACSDKVFYLISFHIHNNEMEKYFLLGLMALYWILVDLGYTINFLGLGPMLLKSILVEY